MPASIGWHPWFVKPTRTDLRFERMYLRDDDYIADGRDRQPAATASVGRLLRRATGDTTAVDRRSRGVDQQRLRVLGRLRHAAHATCVEPQTATPDAFNLPVRPAALYGSHLAKSCRGT